MVTSFFQSKVVQSVQTFGDPLEASPTIRKARVTSAFETKVVRRISTSRG
jgi:hypothetical protein